MKSFRLARECSHTAALLLAQPSTEHYNADLPVQEIDVSAKEWLASPRPSHLLAAGEVSPRDPLVRKTELDSEHARAFTRGLERESLKLLGCPQ